MEVYPSRRAKALFRTNDSVNLELPYPYCRYLTRISWSKASDKLFLVAKIFE